MSILTSTICEISHNQSIQTDAATARAADAYRYVSERDEKE